jgi:hypothetical protein
MMVNTDINGNTMVRAVFIYFIRRWDSYFKFESFPPPFERRPGIRNIRGRKFRMGGTSLDHT